MQGCEEKSFLEWKGMCCDDPNLATALSKGRGGGSASLRQYLKAYLISQADFKASFLYATTFRIYFHLKMCHIILSLFFVGLALYS